MDQILINEQGELERESEMHLFRLDNCKTELEAKAEIVFHFEREYYIKQKYKEHREEFQRGGRSLF